jgi:hypothetical protein
MKKMRFYIGRALMNLGLFVMPFEALASVRWNEEFLETKEG